MITGQQIVEDARKYLGAPYKVGGRSRVGLDCVGLVMLIARDFGLNWECETPQRDPDSGTVAPEAVDTIVKTTGLIQIPVTDGQLGDLVVLRVPLGGAGTVKIISGVDGLASFFGVSKFINFVEPTFLEERMLSLSDMASIKRELKMDVQEYVKRLWRFYRFPFVSG
jgi:hypothetical protein